MAAGSPIDAREAHAYENNRYADDDQDDSGSDEHGNERHSGVGQRRADRRDLCDLCHESREQCSHPAFYNM